MKLHSRALNAFATAGLLSLFAASQAQAQTTTMDFAGLGLSVYNAIPANYGSHGNLSVTNRTRGAFGNGPVNSCGNTTQVSYWTTGYSDLVDNVFACYNGGVGEFFFAPLNGQPVTLNYLDLGSYLAGPNGVGPSRPYDVRVYDTNWNSVFAATGTVTSTQRINFATTSATGLYLQWGTHWDVGVDNISTTVAGVPQSTVPEPATLAFMVPGLLAAAAFARRRKQRA